MNAEIEELVPQGPDRDPVGRIVVNGRQVGMYRCVEEKVELLREAEELSLTE